MIKLVWLAPYPLEELKSVHFSKRVKTFGTGTWLVNLSEELAKNEDIELHIICETANILHNQCFSENGIQFHLIRNNVPFTNKGYPGYFPFQEMTGYFFNTRRIKKLLNIIKPDIVHAQGTENSYAIAALGSKYPSVISIQGVMREIAKIQSSLRMKLKAQLEAKAVRSGHHFICRTNLDTSLIESLNPHAEMYIVHEAINNYFFNNRWILPGGNNLLYVGSLYEHKGISVLLKAMPLVLKSIPDVILSIVGNGPPDYVSKLRNLCESGDIIKNVRFLGYQSPQNIAALHLKSQLFICPSLIENSPNAVAEAMVSGMPVLATLTGGIPSMIEDCETGVLTEPGNPQKLAEKIISLIMDPVERMRLGKNALKVAREKHLPSSVAEKTIDVYKNILNRSQISC